MPGVTRSYRRQGRGVVWGTGIINMRGKGAEVASSTCEVRDEDGRFPCSYIREIQSCGCKSPD